jgi:hypothetical protein
VEPQEFSAVCHLARRTQEQIEKKRQIEEASKAQQDFGAVERDIFAPLDDGLILLSNASGEEHNQPTAGALFELSPEEVEQVYNIIAGLEQSGDLFEGILDMPWKFDTNPPLFVEEEETRQQKRKQDATNEIAGPWRTVDNSRSHRKSYCPRQAPCHSCEAFIETFDVEAESQHVRKGCESRPVAFRRRIKRVKN